MALRVARTRYPREYRVRPLNGEPLPQAFVTRRLFRHRQAVPDTKIRLGA